MLNDSNEKPGEVETSSGLCTMGHEVEVGLVIGSVSSLCLEAREMKGTRADVSHFGTLVWPWEKFLLPLGLLLALSVSFRDTTV